MLVTADMKIADVLALNEEKMMHALLWLSPEFERLQHPTMRDAMGNRVTVSQAARIAHIPLTEALYVLNMAAGEEPLEIAEELQCLPKFDFEFHETNPPRKPNELLGILDEDEEVIFIDVGEEAEHYQDTLPHIMRGFFDLKAATEKVLLVHHAYDPIPIRDLFAREGFASWAEERHPGKWYIYFYRPVHHETAIAHPPICNHVFLKIKATWT